MRKIAILIAVAVIVIAGGAYYGLQVYPQQRMRAGLDQSFVKVPEKSVKEFLTETIAKTGENIQIRRFVRFQLGS